MSVVSVVGCQVQVSATGRPLIQRSPTECSVSECVLETSATRRPRPTRAVEPRGRNTTGNNRRFN